MIIFKNGSIFFGWINKNGQIAVVDEAETMRELRQKLAKQLEGKIA